MTRYMDPAQNPFNRKAHIKQRLHKYLISNRPITESGHSEPRHLQHLHLIQRASGTTLKITQK
jgi:hypothetical protein